ncbi:MAG: sigma-70 family RNA polymerase sigma factor [Bacteroidales bacterium]|nr:sigma-70 family RNA polymerase sigma factor [Bacteroidales bacterium]MBN2820535.1 sigma-70 family RNA polymerase sigma factor [Bacteroidales bacterium]
MVIKNSFSEQKIVEECLKNNRTYQKILYDKYKDGMYTVVFRIIRNESLSCDALQEGFIQVFLNLRSFEFKSTLGSWIKTIMIRNALKVLRKEIRFEELGDTEINIPFSWDENLTGEVLDKAISKLSPGYRFVFLLIEVEGYSHKEVAEMLNISVGTSKSQLSRAKAILQNSLKGIYA